MKREHYIPIDKERILESQIADFYPNQSEAEELNKLFRILEHYFHYEGFNQIKSLKREYASFDPDKTLIERNESSMKSNLQIFKENIKFVIDRGNYVEIKQEELTEALKKSDLVGLKLNINFNDFKDFKVFVRGNGKAIENSSKFFFWRKEKEIEYYDRVIIYLEYQDQIYFESINQDLSELSFTPSSVILKIFKRVPKNDLETIFPNATPEMTLKDKLLLWIPAVVGGFPLLMTKLLPPLLTIYASYKLGKTSDGDSVKKSLLEGLIALGLIGAYLFRQYRQFLNKKMQFSKLLSDSLYFKNIANNSGVFPSLIDAAEEEKLKEIILAYSFLNLSKEGLTPKELDSNIENWFLSKFNKELDFDLEDALLKIEDLGIGYQQDGKWKAVSPQKALERIDDIWDSILNYSLDKKPI